MSHPWPFCEPMNFKFIRSVGRFDDAARKALQKAYLNWIDKKPGGSRSVVEHKVDGWRCALVKDADGITHIYTHGISAVTGSYRDLLVADHKQPGGPIPAVLAVAELLEPECVAEVELVWPGHRAAEVPTMLKSFRHEADVIVFALPIWKGKRVLTWQLQHNAINNLELKRPLIYAGGAHILTPEALSEAASALGIEGFMVKLCDTEGDPVWWKAKREVDIDVIVVDTKDSQGDVRGTTGMVGSLIVGVMCLDHTRAGPHECWDLDLEDGGEPIKVREVASVSGISDEEREQMTQEREDLVGRVCEIRCQASGGIFGGRARHPRFMRWREDKPARECFDQDLYGEVPEANSGEE